MKHYKNSDNEVYAYESDGSQDHLIPDNYIAITDEEADAIRIYVKTYVDLREEEYPSIQECVHAILDDDLTALQEKRQAIKTKYPKG